MFEYVVAMLMIRYKHKLQISSLLSDEVVYERETSSEIKGLYPDVNGNIFLYTEHDIFQVSTHCC